MNIDLSIVMVSFNTRDLLRDCLRSVYDALEAKSLSPKISFEVWVVDNASGDASAAMVRDEFPAAHLIVNQKNVGFAAANNQALVQASGRYFLLLNPDTVVLGSALQRLVRFMDEHPRAGAAGPSLLNPDGTFQHSAFHFPSLLMSFFDFFPLNHRLASSRLNGRYPLSYYAGQPFCVGHPLGACLLVRNDAVKQLGALDEQFYIYCEEIDLCLRFKRGGWEIYCVPDAKVVHYGGQSTRQFRGAMLVELHRARKLLFQKHRGRLFQYLNARIVALGINAEVRRARGAAARGEIQQQDLADRLAAFSAITHLSQIR